MVEAGTTQLAVVGRVAEQLRRRVETEGVRLNDRRKPLGQIAETSGLIELLQCEAGEAWGRRWCVVSALVNPAAIKIGI